MNIETIKINLIEQILKIQNVAVLKAIEKLLDQEVSSLSSEQKQAIDAGIKSLDEGRGIAHEEVMKESKLRYPDLFLGNRLFSK